MFYLYLSNKHFNFQKANLAHAYQTRCIFTKKKKEQQLQNLVLQKKNLDFQIKIKP